MAVLICIHVVTYMHIHKTTFFDHENIMCRHSFGDDIMHNCQYILKKIDVSAMVH